MLPSTRTKVSHVPFPLPEEERKRYITFGSYKKIRLMSFVHEQEKQTLCLMRIVNSKETENWSANISMFSEPENAVVNIISAAIRP